MVILAGLLTAAAESADDDASRCAVLDSADLRSLCLSLRDGDASYCRRIRDPDIREWCRSQSGEETLEGPDQADEAGPPRRPAGPRRR
ncbi:hypothetical protein [Methylobacterium sp. JK268]